MLAFAAHHFEQETRFSVPAFLLTAVIPRWPTDVRCIRYAA